MEHRKSDLSDKKKFAKKQWEPLPWKVRKAGPGVKSFAIRACHNVSMNLEDIKKRDSEAQKAKDAYELSKSVYSKDHEHTKPYKPTLFQLITQGTQTYLPLDGNQVGISMAAEQEIRSSRQNVGKKNSKQQKATNTGSENLCHVKQVEKLPRKDVGNKPDNKPATNKLRLKLKIKLAQKQHKKKD